MLGHSLPLLFDNTLALNLSFESDQHLTTLQKVHLHHEFGAIH